LNSGKGDIHAYMIDFALIKVVPIGVLSDSPHRIWQSCLI
jgi:hypothetical protein